MHISKNCLFPFRVSPFHLDFKLDFSNYCPISLLFNFEKSLKMLMYNRIYKFFNDNNLVSPLQFGFRQKFLTVPVLINLDEGNIG